MRKIIAQKFGKFVIGGMIATALHIGTCVCHSQDDQREEDLLNQLQTAELKAINGAAGGDKKTPGMLTAYLEGGGNPRLNLLDKNAAITMRSVETALIDAIHAGRLATARNVAIFTLSNTEAVKAATEGEVRMEWTFEAACLALWLCERYPEYPDLVRSCWPKDEIGELKAKEKKAKILSRFINLYFADRSKDPESQYIQIQLFLSSEEDAVLKALLQQTAVHLIQELIRKHEGKDGEVVTFELYCDLLRLPYLMESHEGDIYLDASEFFGSIGDEKRERLARTKTIEYPHDIYFEGLEEFDRNKGKPLSFLEEVICFAIRTAEYRKLRDRLNSLSTDIQR